MLASPNLFGIFKVSANAPIHVIHAAVAVVSLAVGYMARGSRPRRWPADDRAFDVPDRSTRVHGLTSTTPSSSSSPP